MRKKLPFRRLARHLLTILFILFIIHPLSAATTFEYAGAKYEVISESEKTCKIINGQSLSGNISLPSNPNGYKLVSIAKDAFWECSSLRSVTIPNSVTWIGTDAFGYCRSLTSVTLPNSVTSIGKDAFRGCSSLTSVMIPNSVTWIGEGAFGGCSSLTSVAIPNSVTSIGEDAFQSCSSLTSVMIPNSVTSIGEGAFGGCSSLTSVAIPNSVTSIRWRTFWECSSLTSVMIPNSVTWIDWQAFCGCSSLTSITIPNSVTSIGESAFGGCSSLTSITLPNSVKSIGDYAFRGCSSLTSVAIPKSVKSIGDYAFRDCSLSPLVIYGDPSLTNKTFSGLKTESIIYCLPSLADRIKSLISCSVYPLDMTYIINAYPSSSTSLDLRIYENDYFDGAIDVSKSFSLELVSDVTSEVIYSMDELLPNDVTVNDLPIAWKYTLKLYENTGSTKKLFFSSKITLPSPVFYLNTSSVTQKSITIDKIECDLTSGCYDMVDSAFKNSIPGFKEAGIYCKGSKYPYNGSAIKFDNLIPETELEFTPYIVYNNGDNEYRASKMSYRTEGWDINCVIEHPSPTIASLKVSYLENGCSPDKCYWSFSGTDYPGDTLSLLSLTPDSNYSARFTIEYKGKKYSNDYNFKTSALELTTLQPKCVSESSAIVAAETNISNLEPSVGFEWRKYDAPETMASNSALAPVVDGMVEGYIKNLQSTSYYNVRVFYQDYKGNKYYGEWVTFDPSNFSFFEPTVRTYPAERVGENRAVIRGYVLPGTDAIRSQGFQYWETNPVRRARSFAPAVSDIMTVTASGQVMVVNLENLKSGTEYTFRVFVETDAGYVYGEEQTFTTEIDYSGVDTINGCDDNEATVVGYYNMQGIRFNKLQQGFNIVLYSDGTSGKIYLSTPFSE